MLNTILYVLGIVAAVWVIYDVWTQNKGASTGVKVVWTVCAVLFSILTAIVYYFVGRK